MLHEVIVRGLSVSSFIVCCLLCWLPKVTQASRNVLNSHMNASRIVWLLDSILRVTVSCHLIQDMVSAPNFLKLALMFIINCF